MTLMCNYEKCMKDGDRCAHCTESYCNDHMEAHMRRRHLLEYAKLQRVKQRTDDRARQKDRERLRPYLGHEHSSGAGIAMLVATIIVALLIMLVIVGSVKVIPAGHKGVIVSSPTGPDKAEVNEGWQWNLRYLVSDVELVEYRTQTVDFVGQDESDADAGSITISSKDNILVHMDFSIVYSIEPDKVADLVIENGMNYKHRIITPIARSVPRDIGARYNAMQIRGEFRSEVETAIAQNITLALAQKYILVERFAMRDIRLPAQLENAIETKKVAEQNVLTQQYNLAAEQYVANKTIVRMSAQAAATLINASAFANATVIKAHGQAEAMSLIMAHLNSTMDNATKDYLAWVYLQALSDPNSNIKYVVVPSDGGIPVLISVKDDSGSP